MSEYQRSTTRRMWWWRWIVAVVAGTIMFMTGNAFLKEKLNLWEKWSLHLEDQPPDVPIEDWYLQCENTQEFCIVFCGQDLMRDDNLERRDTRADIGWWHRVIDAVRILLPLACGVVVWVGLFILWGMLWPHRNPDEV